MKKNIILITIDSLRTDYLSCYEHHKKTKNIDILAKNGILFKNAFSNGANTLASVSIMMTSYYLPFITQNTPTLAEVLKKHGYKTVAFNPNVLMLYGFARKVKITRGFEIYNTLLSSQRKILEPYIEIGIAQAGKLLELFSLKNKRLFSYLIKPILYAPLPIDVPCPRADILTQKSLDWIKRNKDKPFFIWINYMDVHEPYLPINRYKSLFQKIKMWAINRKLRYFKSAISLDELNLLKELYYEELVYVDHNIGILVDKLQEYSILDKTVIILTSDHGEQFMEHGSLAHPNKGLYKEQLHVPLIIYNYDKNKVLKQKVSLKNIPKTIVEMLGINYNGFRGYNILKIESDEDPIISYGGTTNPYISVISGRYKLIIRKIKNKKYYELYDLSSDPAETKNIANEHYDVVNLLENKFIEALTKEKTSISLKNKTLIQIKKIKERMK